MAHSRSHIKHFVRRCLEYHRINFPVAEAGSLDEGKYLIDKKYIALPNPILDYLTSYLTVNTSRPSSLYHNKILIYQVLVLVQCNVRRQQTGESVNAGLAGNKSAVFFLPHMGRN